MTIRRRRKIEILTPLLSLSLAAENINFSSFHPIARQGMDNKLLNVNLYDFKEIFPWHLHICSFVHFPHAATARFSLSLTHSHSRQKYVGWISFFCLSSANIFSLNSPRCVPFVCAFHDDDDVLLYLKSNEDDDYDDGKVASWNEKINNELIVEQKLCNEIYFFSSLSHSL